MTNSCEHCGARADNPMRVDVPKGLRLCARCFVNYTWTCDSCGNRIAFENIKGHFWFGHSPVEFELWCVKCCEEKAATCDRCGSEDLVEFMSASEDELLCEKCAAGPTEPDNSPVFTKDNWISAVQEAINELPSDVALFVSIGEQSDGCLAIRVACDPFFAKDVESSVRETRVRWWNTRREELEHYIRESPRVGYEQDLLDESTKPMIDEPSISIEDCVVISPNNLPRRDCVFFRRNGLQPGRAGVASLKRMIQVAVLDELCDFGSVSTLGRDKRGRVRRENGSYVLEWQEPKGYHE